MKFSFKTTTKKAVEAILVLSLVLLFFLAILFTLNKVFPTGLKLLNLVRPGAQDSSPYSDHLASRELRLNTGTGEFGLGDGDTVTAVLSSLNNQVKAKRANQIAWQGAEKGMTFHDRDAIQSFRKSFATVFFKKGNFLELHENSLIVLRSLERDVFIRENHMTVVLVNGQLNGRIGIQDQENYNLEVIAPGVVARAPSRGNKDQPSQFQMSVGPDDTSILTVHEGTVDFLIDGKTIGVGTDQVVKIQPGKALVYLRPPPRAPALTSPANDETFTVRDIPPRVSFGWHKGGNVQGYHFVLARDPGYQDIFYEGRFEDNQFFHGNLNQGDYYWRVSSVSSNGEGAFGRARHLRLI
ncbi:MAG: hypothetical protein RRA15_12895 [bacterium]|nr:hypothetical protein [bacterium]MDT8367358.1 hypothetical protein [bacterium]